MSVITSCPGKPPIGRILRPYTVLKRLRPVSLNALIERATRAQYRVKAIALINRYFPEQLAVVQVSPGLDAPWLEIFGHFLRLVEGAGWFEVDWDRLSSLEEGWCQSGENSYEDHLALYLDNIPVRVYGIGEDDQDVYNALWILRMLLDEYTRVDPDFLIGYELYDALDDIFSKEEILCHVRNADYSHLPEPLCWLDEICEIAAGNGNQLLTETFETTDYGMSPFLWERDLERVKALYREARPAIKRLQAFRDWLAERYEADGYNTEETNQQILELVLGASYL
jgi:hypothetical protein